MIGVIVTVGFYSILVWIVVRLFLLIILYLESGLHWVTLHWIAIPGARRGGT
jgi:hypothetical protein